MKYIKTYGVTGLLEWHGIITNHGAKMKADFTNGSVTAYGVSPATFTTKNEFTQAFIEGSDQFKSGRIRIVRSTPLPESEQPKPVVETPTAPTEEINDTPAEDTPSTDDLKVVEVATKADAIDYLKENFPEENYTAAKLRAERLDKAASDHGIKFVITA